MLFVCTKYPNYHLPNVRVTFEDGYAEVSNRSAISYLNGAFMRRRGIRRASQEEVEAYAKRNAATEEPVSQDPPAIETPGETEATDTVDAVSLAEVETDGETSSFGSHAEHEGEPVPPEGTAAEVLAWVDGDAGRASAALEAENERDKPRSTLIAKLETLAE